MPYVNNLPVLPAPFLTVSFSVVLLNDHRSAPGIESGGSGRGTA